MKLKNLISEKNIPTNKALWDKFVDQARKKFDVYPSAYANGWAAKQYKDAGGKWKTEEAEEPQHVAVALPQTKQVDGKKIGERFMEYLQDNGLKHAAYQNENGDIKIVGLNKEQVKEALGKLVNEWQSKNVESVNEAYPTNLKVGSVIMGQGFTMLKSIEGGRYYKVVEMDNYSATLVPSDKNGNVKGSKKVRHKLDSIEGGIKTAKRGDENGIVIVKESVNEIKVNYDFKPEELKKIIQTLKRHYGTLIPPIKAMEKALGKEIPAYESYLKKNTSAKREGFPGGAGVGVSLPGGYINGAPSEKDVKKMKKNLK